MHAFVLLLKSAARFISRICSTVFEIWCSTLRGVNTEIQENRTRIKHMVLQWSYTRVSSYLSAAFHWCNRWSLASLSSASITALRLRLSLNIHEESPLVQSDASALMRRLPHVPVTHRERERCCWSRCGTSVDVTEVNKPNLLSLLWRFSFIYSLL